MSLGRSGHLHYARSRSRGCRYGRGRAGRCTRSMRRRTSGRRNWSGQRGCNADRPKKPAVRAISELPGVAENDGEALIKDSEEGPLDKVVSGAMWDHKLQTPSRTSAWQQTPKKLRKSNFNRNAAIFAQGA